MDLEIGDVFDNMETKTSNEKPRINHIQMVKECKTWNVIITPSANFYNGLKATELYRMQNFWICELYNFPSCISSRLPEYYKYRVSNLRIP